MKKATEEFRMYIAEVLLNWSESVAPVSIDGNRLRAIVFKYFIDGSK